jgi:hypothetical protein
MIGQILSRFPRLAALRTPETSYSIDTLVGGADKPIPTGARFTLSRIGAGVLRTELGIAPTPATRPGARLHYSPYREEDSIQSTVILVTNPDIPGWTPCVNVRRNGAFFQRGMVIPRAKRSSSTRG